MFLGGFMLCEIKKYDAVDERKLMDLYYEDNLMNIKWFCPEVTNKEEAIKLIEKDYLFFLKSEFFKRDNVSLWVLIHEDVWVSALRLYKISDNEYFIEALATHPYYRHQGFASKLIIGIINELKKNGSFTIYSEANKKNIASIKTHQKCGFEIVSDKGYDYIFNEYSDNDYSLKYTYKK